MRELLLQKHMTIESVHLTDSEYADRAKALTIHIENLTFCDISLERCVRTALQPEESDITGLDIAFHRSTSDVRLLQLRLQIPLHYQLIAHMRILKKTAACISAMEAHEDLLKTAAILLLYGFIIHALWNCIVYIKERYWLR